MAADPATRVAVGLGLGVVGFAAASATDVSPVVGFVAAAVAFLVLVLATDL